MSSPLRPIVIGVLVLLFAGCGEDTGGDTSGDTGASGAQESGASASDDTAAGVQTRGEGCELTGRAGCMRALTCNLTFTDVELCTSMAVGDCCEDAGTCDEAATDGVWEACAAALETQACEEVGMVPMACEALALGN